MPKRRPQADHRADTRGGALSGLPHVVADSPAYLDLCPFERGVLGEILRRFNGYNNGTIGISYEELGERLRGPNATRPHNGRLARAIVRLIDHGFLAEPTPGSWLQRRAREYRLTFITSGKAPPFKSATNDYQLWTPTQAKIVGDARSPEKPPSDDARSPEAPLSGDARSPRLPKNGSFALDGGSVSGDAGSPLICKPYGGPEMRGLGWWETDPKIRVAQFALAVISAAHPSNLIPFPSRANQGECELCGNSFKHPPQGAPKRYCSETCRKRAERQRARQRARS